MSSNATNRAEICGSFDYREHVRGYLCANVPEHVREHWRENMRENVRGHMCENLCENCVKTA